MVRIAAEGLRHDCLEPGLDRFDCLARGQAGAVADPEDMCVDCERFFPKGRVEDDVGGLATDSGQRLQRLARPRHLATMIPDQRLGQCDHVLRLRIEQADRLDRLA